MRRDKSYSVHILANRYNTTLYIGVTNDLERRIEEHKLHENQGFSKKYNLEKLVYYEDYENIEYAIAREKQLKGGSRAKKVALVISANPGWLDLAKDWKRTS